MYDSMNRVDANEGMATQMPSENRRGEEEKAPPQVEVEEPLPLRAEPGSGLGPRSRSLECRNSIGGGFFFYPQLLHDTKKDTSRTTTVPTGSLIGRA